MVVFDYFGSLRALFVILVSFVVLVSCRFLLKRYVLHLAAKTKSELDDLILALVTKPLYVLILAVGFYVAFRTLEVPEYYSRAVNSAFFVVAVVLISVLLVRIFTVCVNHWLKIHKRLERTPQVLNKMVAVIVYVLALLMILGHFQVEITPLIATLGLGGLAVGLALQNTLTNFFAGLHIISDRPVNVGDFIELEGNISGFVDDVGWRSTRIRTLPNAIVVIPNAKLAESVIINDSLPDKEIAALVQCGVSYVSDLKKVEKVTVEVARHIQTSVEGAVKTFEPFIRYHTFGDSNINFTVILRVEKYVDKYLIIHEFIKALKERYDKEHIEISWPVRKVYRGRLKRSK